MTAMVFLILIAQQEASGLYSVYLWSLFAVNIICLLFDYTDAYKWLMGEREVAGPVKGSVP